jgi:NDP-sugar pyrophosphorylase family protein
MKAMILAAGLGTRLRPLTNDRPKALVEVAGKTLLEITLRRLASFGIRDVIVNVHHFADLVIDYLQENSNFGMNIEVSREELLLDTGGGLKKAAWFFLDGQESEQDFILHNVDVISTIDLTQMVRFHQEHHALATLAVKKRETSRYLLFDERDQLCGRQRGNGTMEMARSCPQRQPYAFCGIHVISSQMLPRLREDGAFSIIASYLRLAHEGEKITAFHADQAYWLDLGKPQNVEQACRDAELQLIPI